MANAISVSTIKYVFLNFTLISLSIKPLSWAPIFAAFTSSLTIDIKFIGDTCVFAINKFISKLPSANFQRMYAHAPKATVELSEKTVQGLHLIHLGA